MDNKLKGLYGKYIIHKADGSEVSKDSEYFVLRLDEQSNDPIHLNACRKAILTYAENIKDHLPLLYNDLLEKYS
jgi:hypothetical protein